MLKVHSKYLYNSLVRYGMFTIMNNGKDIFNITNFRVHF